MKIQIMGTFIGNFHQPHASCFFNPSILLSVVTLIRVTDDIVIFFCPEDRGNTFLRNVGDDRWIHTASHLKRKHSCYIHTNILMGHNGKWQRWKVRKMCHQQQPMKPCFSALVVPFWRIWLCSSFWCAFCADTQIYCSTTFLLQECDAFCFRG